MTIPGWYLDELAHAGREHLDSGYVPGYDAKSATDPTGDLDILIEFGLDQRSTLIDLGAGTGTFALAAAPIVKRVIAVDVSPVMLSEFAAELKRRGFDNVEIVNAGFLSYRANNEPADFVYSRRALHHVPDFWKAIALQRIAGMLKPGGVLLLRDLVYSFDLAEADTVLEGWFARAVATPGVGWTGPELQTHVRDEYSTFSWLLEPMLEHAGFRIVCADERESLFYATYTCIKDR